MKPDNFEKKSVRKANNNKYNKRIVSLIALSAVVVSTCAVTKNISADNK